MTKKRWLTVVILVVGAAIVLAIFSIVFQSRTGVALPWWAYPVALIIYALIVYLVILLVRRSSQKFDAMLAKAYFNTDKQYQWNQNKLLIDFQSKRIANTYISTKPLIGFSDIVGYRFETYQSGVNEDLPDDKRFVSLVLTVKKEGFEYEYLYIPMYEIAVDTEDIGDGIKEISPELLEKYPEFADMKALCDDICKILEINAANGVVSHVSKD